MQVLTDLKEQRVQVPPPQLQGQRSSLPTSQAQESESRKDQDTDVKIVIKATKVGQDLRDHIKVTIKAVTLLPMDQICSQGTNQEQAIQTIESKLRHLLQGVHEKDWGQGIDRPPGYNVRMEVKPMQGERKGAQKDWETQSNPMETTSSMEDASKPMGQMKLGAKDDQSSESQQERSTTEKPKEIAQSDKPMMEKMQEGVAVAKEEALGSQEASVTPKLKQTASETISKSKEALGATMTAFEADDASSGRRISQATPQEYRTDIPLEPVTHQSKENNPGNIPERIKAAVGAAVHVLKGDS
jgi:hypothetical protein